MMNGTGFVVCAVCGAPVSRLIICSALPWSAVMSKTYPASLHASYMVPTAASVFVMASTAASNTPVCPTYTIERMIQLMCPLENEEGTGRTISGGAKLHMTKSCSAFLRTSATLSATPCTLILGSLSYVATLGDGIRCLSSPSNCFSTPPLKKKVTWAYFSVSAWCQRPVQAASRETHAHPLCELA